MNSMFQICWNTTDIQKVLPPGRGSFNMRQYLLWTCWVGGSGAEMTHSSFRWFLAVLLSFCLFSACLNCFRQLLWSPAGSDRTFVTTLFKVLMKWEIRKVKPKIIQKIWVETGSLFLTKCKVERFSEKLVSSELNSFYHFVVKTDNWSQLKKNLWFFVVLSANRK